MKDEKALCGHSPFFFLLADTLPNNLLDFRIHDFVVASWLHALRKGKYKQKADRVQLRDTMLMNVTKEKEFG